MAYPLEQVDLCPTHFNEAEAPQSTSADLKQHEVPGLSMLFSLPDIRRKIYQAAIEHDLQARRGELIAYGMVPRLTERLAIKSPRRDVR